MSDELEGDQRHPLHWLPNALTIFRCIGAVVLGMLTYIFLSTMLSYAEALAKPFLSDTPLPLEEHMEVVKPVTEPLISKLKFSSSLALGLFILLCATDFADGYFARRFKAISKFGTFWDPIADKLLFAAPFLVLSIITLQIAPWWQLVIFTPVYLIIIRDILVTFWRQSISSDKMPVTQLAKWKTGLELSALAMFYLFLWVAMRSNGIGQYVLLVLFIVGVLGAATLSLIAGYQYWRIYSEHKKNGHAKGGKSA